MVFERITSAKCSVVPTTLDFLQFESACPWNERSGRQTLNNIHTKLADSIKSRMIREEYRVLATATAGWDFDPLYMKENHWNSPLLNHGRPHGPCMHASSSVLRFRGLHTSQKEKVFDKIPENVCML